MFADVDRYRLFITDPTPTWAPTQKTAVTITGARTRTCVAAARERGTKLSIEWKRRTHHAKLETVGTGRRYTPAKADAGHRIVCFVSASNDGGEILAGTASVMIAR